MASKKKRAGGAAITLRWPFAQTDIGTNKDTSLLKIIAMIAMLIDHSGKMLFPQFHVMRLIGRLAFPIYAYCAAVGCVYTKDALKYLERIVLLALISQPIYAVAMAHTCAQMYTVSFSEQPLLAAINFYAYSWYHPSVFLTLAFGIIACWSIREQKPVFMIAAALLVWKLAGHIDYGWQGVALIALFYVTCAKWWLTLPVVGAFMLWWAALGSGYEVFGVSFSSQLFAVCALPLICIPMKTNIRVNKWLYYWYYPAHLALILLLDTYVFI